MVIYLLLLLWLFLGFLCSWKNIEQKKKTMERELELTPLLSWGAAIYNILDSCLSYLLVAGNFTAFPKQLIPVLYILTDCFFPN